MMGLFDLQSARDKLKGLLGEMPLVQIAQGRAEMPTMAGLLGALKSMPVGPDPQGAYDAALNIGPMGIGSVKKVFGDPTKYQGGHKPSGPGSGAPLHDVTQGVYPDDIYGPNGFRYYGLDNQPGEYAAYSQILSSKGRPNRQVTIYRAVPYEPTPSELADKLEKQKAKYMARRLLPTGVDLSDEVKWYEETSKKIEELRATPKQDQKVFGINPGDWVALSREYAKAHGKSALGGNYKIVSTKAKASDLFTSGDSLSEWGWFPNSGLLGGM